MYRETGGGSYCRPKCSKFYRVHPQTWKVSGYSRKNQVLEGIELVSMLLHSGKIFFLQNCRDSIREFSLYRWSEKAQKDQPVKENDHAMDEIRYFAMEVFRPKRSGFCAIAQERENRS